MQKEKLRLLIADDHQLFVEGLKSIFNNSIQVQVTGVAYSGKETIEKCLKEEYDVVLMDVNMPLLDGIYACAEIKRHKPLIKVIFISMLTDLITVSNALKAGADAYVLKGNGMNDITSAFKTVIKNEIFISEQLRHYFSDDKPNSKKNTSVEFLSFSQNIISQREKEVLKQIVDGLTNEQIAGVLSISVRTVDTHRSNMLTKLKLPNTAALVRFALENKLLG
jgi:DNA-binding NarL/FixJ family response regulator